MRRRLIVGAGLLVAITLLGACATGAATDEPSEPAFATEPAAPQPRLSVEWRKNLDQAKFGEYRTRQYATPHILRTADRRELLVGTAQGTLFRFRASDGKLRWRAELDGPIYAEPVANRRRVYVGTANGSFYAIDRKTGEVDWKVDNPRAIESQAAVESGIVFYTTNAGRLVAVDESSGEKAWTYSRSLPKEFTVQGSGTPVIDRRTVYCGFADGTVAALDVMTGQVNWETNVSGDVTEYTDVDGPVTIRDDRIYVTSYGAGISVLDREGGNPIWSRSFGNVASAKLVGESIYLAIATGRVVALDAETGQGEWGFKMSHYLPVDLSATDSYVFVSTGSGPLYALDRATGYPLMTWKPSNGFSTPVAFSERAGYLLSNRGYLYAIRLAY